MVRTKNKPLSNLEVMTPWVDKYLREVVTAEVLPHRMVFALDLYGWYLQWALTNKAPLVNIKVFGVTMTSMGFLRLAGSKRGVRYQLRLAQTWRQPVSRLETPRLLFEDALGKDRERLAAESKGVTP